MDIVTDLAVIEILHSSCFRGPSDDAFGMRNARSGFHIWVIDGASSIAADPNRYRPDMSDPAWFARALSKRIFRLVGRAPLTASTLRHAVADCESRYMARCAGRVPPFEYPLAAMTYAHIRQVGGLFVINRLDFADCFLHLQPLRPSMPRPAMAVPAYPPYAPLARDGAAVAELRKRRRALMQNDAGSTVLTIRSGSAGCGVWSRLQVSGPTLLAIGSDGIERAWTSYGLLSFREAAAIMADRRALGLLAELRRWERGNIDHGLEVKAADDATLITVALGAGHSRPGDKTVARIRQNGLDYLRAPNGLRFGIGRGMCCVA